jgi:peptidoglycan/LPS O-acetylase OafA/YrhL
MSAPADSRNTALDGLRGLAALSVVFYHALLHREDLIASVLSVPIQQLGTAQAILQKLYLTLFNGHSAVLLFFVLSGLVLARSLERHAGNPLATSLNFALARAFRLYPALAFCMACYYALAWLYAWAGWSGFPAPDWRAAAINASLVDIRWHGPSTTLQGEMLAIPFLLATFFIGRRFPAIGVPACFAYAVFAFDNPWLVGWLPNMNVWLPAFLLGMLLADRRLAPFFQPVSGAGLAALLVLFVGLRAFTNLNASTTSIGQILLCGALVGAVYHGAPQLAVIRLLNRPALQFLGRISYSLYLLNVLLLMVAWSVVDRTDCYQQQPLLTGTLVGVLVSLLSLPLAAFSQRVFEQGGVQLWQSLRQRPGALASHA